jgi:Ca2+-binding EF-hand superfamily protein
LNIRKITTALALSLVVGTTALAADAAANAAAKTDNVDTWFVRFDHNKDGQLTLDEFGLGKSYFTALDIDRNGVLTRDEAKKALAQAQTDDSLVDLRKLDTDGDGVVSRREWTGTQEAFDKFDVDRDGALSRKDRELSRELERAQKRFESMDKNKDGVISRDEWPGNDASYRLQDRNRNGSITQDELVEQREPRQHHS